MFRPLFQILLVVLVIVGCGPNSRQLNEPSIQDLFDFGSTPPIGPDALEDADLDHACLGHFGNAGSGINKAEAKVVEFLAGGLTQPEIDAHCKALHEWIASEFVIQTSGTDYRLVKKLLNEAVTMLKQELRFVPDFHIYIITPRNNLAFYQAFTTGNNIYFSQDLLKLLSGLQVSYPYSQNPEYEERVLSVLLHEVGHTICEDHLIHIYRSKIFQDFFGKRAGSIGARIYSAIISPFEKEDEFRADLFATWAMWKLNLSPYAVSAVWTAMETYQSNESMISEILSSHPAPADRAQCIYSFIQEAQNKASNK